MIDAEGQLRIEAARRGALNDQIDGELAPILFRCGGIRTQRVEVFVDVLRNRFQEQLARAPRIEQQEIFEHLDRCISRPLIDGNAASHRLGNLVPFLVEKHLEGKPNWRPAAKHLENLS